MAYCSECMKKLLPWMTSDQPSFPSWFDDFHRDLYELIECSNRCTLCEYICNLFGRFQLEGFLARVAEYSSTFWESIDLDVAKHMDHNKVGFRTSLPASQTAKDPPTVSIRNDTYHTRVDADGHLDHFVVVVLLQHHISDVRDDSRSFMIHTETGTLMAPQRTCTTSYALLMRFSKSIQSSHLWYCRCH